MKNFLQILGITAVAVISIQNVQAQSVSTFQAIRIERPDAPGVFITLEPPTTAITPYTMRWPATAPTAGLSLTTNGSGPYQMLWTSAGLTTVEMVTTPNGNLRRVSSLVSGSNADPGLYSNDFQGSRSSSSQTASGNYSLIGGGENNTAAGNYAAILGGSTNSASGNYSIIGGGQNNTASGTGSAVLGGQQNTSSGTNAAVAGGQQNSISSTGLNGFIGGGQNNSVTGINSSVVGGQNNTASGPYSFVGGGYNNTASDTASVVGAGSNNIASGRYAGIVSGTSNTASGYYSFIGAGQSNTTSGLRSSISGGLSNTASAENASVGGGQSNTAGQLNGFVGGGQNNSVTVGSNSGIVGGSGNSITGSLSFIGGGLSNSIAGDTSTILGGKNLTLGADADNSFGFNAGSAMTVNEAKVGVIANADLWITNTDNTARSLRLYENNSSTGNFPSSANYVAFKASGTMTSDNVYIWPSSIGTAGQVLRIASVGTSPATATLGWGDVMAYSTNNVTITADNTTLTSANQDGRTFLRITSDGTPANRTIVLRNGTIDGFRMIIRVLGTLGTYGIELVDGGGGNLELNGDAQLLVNDTITLVWDNTNSKWIEMMRSDN